MGITIEYSLIKGQFLTAQRVFIIRFSLPCDRSKFCFPFTVDKVSEKWIRLFGKIISKKES
jgi:hypothetical protein